MNDRSPSTHLVRVTGGLTMATSGSWLKTILADRSISSDGVRIDLAGVTDVDSSALAFVSAVERLLCQRGCVVQWLNVPASVLGVAHIYGAEAIFESGSGG
jgi:ABC-type transporter Mla MlaB component